MFIPPDMFYKPRLLPDFKNAGDLLELLISVSLLSCVLMCRSRDAIDWSKISD